METFAFLMHPLRPDDFARKYPFTRRLPPRVVEGIFKQIPPLKISHVRGIRSATGAQAEGWLLALPLTPRQLLESDWSFVLRRLLQSGHLAERLGAKILGLGAFTKIAGDRGISVARNLSIPVTTGNSYTAATAVEGLLHAAKLMGHDPRQVRVAVLGATGSIGSACSQLLAGKVSAMVLTARNRERLELLAGRLRAAGCPEVAIDTDTHRAVRAADLVLAVSSATDALVEPQDLKRGSVVCDVARPRNISAQVHARRDDVLVIDGGVIRVPGNPDFGFDFGFPPGMVEACMAETIMLALEGRYESFTLGPDISVERVQEIHALGRKHGFALAGLRRFERAISVEEVARIRERAARGKLEVRLGEAVVR
ncbi:MAG: shikimate dehydrogenase [Thermaerobacter sp.]|nr:shikimate dehydrogenase [Thermaerobacter sp.]